MARARKKDATKRQRTGGSVDQYLHAMLLLTNHGQPAETGDLAAKVGVSAASASQMLKKLSEAGLVRLEPYKGAELSTEGLHRALRIVRRHRLLELFLHKIVGFDLDELHMRATAIQGAVDESFEEKLDALLGSPKVDPHGRPIPGKNATWPKLGDSPLTNLPPGTTGVVTRILTDQAEAIEYLGQLGITMGTRLALEGISPFEGPVAVRVAGVTVHLGRRLAQAIHMADEPTAPGAGKESTPRR